MSATGITALDHTVQETNVWLKAVEEELQLENRHQAYNALRAVLHPLRDRMPPEVAPARHLLRELACSGHSTKERHAGEFADHVGSELPQPFFVDPLTVTRGVFEILWEKLDPGEFEKAMQHLLAPVRDLKSWD